MATKIDFFQYVVVILFIYFYHITFKIFLYCQ